MADGMIELDEFAPNTFRRLWGVQICDYVVDGAKADFETLVVRYAMKRATTIESEVDPVSKIVNKRNAELSELGLLLSELSRIQADLSGEEHAASETVTLKDNYAETLRKLGTPADPAPIGGSPGAYTISKSGVEKAIQMVKTRMDKLNNESSRDMSRLQSLVDKRDESFSNASTLMQSVSGTRDNSIRNMM